MQRIVPFSSASTIRSRSSSENRSIGFSPSSRILHYSQECLPCHISLITRSISRSGSPFFEIYLLKQRKTSPPAALISSATSSAALSRCDNNSCALLANIFVAVSTLSATCISYFTFQTIQDPPCCYR